MPRHDQPHFVRYPQYERLRDVRRGVRDQWLGGGARRYNPDERMTTSRDTRTRGRPPWRSLRGRSHTKAARTRRDAARRSRRRRVGGRGRVPRRRSSDGEDLRRMLPFDVLERVVYPPTTAAVDRRRRTGVAAAGPGAHANVCEFWPPRARRHALGLGASRNWLLRAKASRRVGRLLWRRRREPGVALTTGNMNINGRRKRIPPTAPAAPPRRRTQRLPGDEIVPDRTGPSSGRCNVLVARSRWCGLLIASS